MNLEVKKDSTHTFNFPEDVFDSLKISKNQKVAISSAKITILTGEGGEVLEEKSMTVAADTYSASYAWDSTDQAVDINYIVKFEVDGTIYQRFFDIYYFPFVNTVTDDDLFAKDKIIKKNSWRVSGKADDGSVTTLKDSNRTEEDDFFDGGIIELYYDDKIEIRDIISFSNSLNEITFLPAVSEAVSQDLGYSARESFQDIINTAADETQKRFNQIKRRAYLLIDHSQIKDAIIYKALANIWRQKIKEKDDEYDIQYQHYLGEYNSYFSNTLWKYDSDYSGTIESDEESETSYPKWER